MSEMVERARVAMNSVPEIYCSRRKIDKSGYEVIQDLDPDGPISDESQKVVFEGSFEMCEAEAIRLQQNAEIRAAIEALREPTKEMVLAMAKEEAVQEYGRDDAWERCVDEDQRDSYLRGAKKVWVAGINAMLKD